MKDFLQVPPCSSFQGREGGLCGLCYRVRRSLTSLKNMNSLFLNHVSVRSVCETGSEHSKLRGRTPVSYSDESDTHGGGRGSTRQKGESTEQWGEIMELMINERGEKDVCSLESADLLTFNEFQGCWLSICYVCFILLCWRLCESYF